MYSKKACTVTNEAVVTTTLRKFQKTSFGK